MNGKGAENHVFPGFSVVGMEIANRQEERKAIMAKESDKIGPGSVLENFDLISYDEDTGRMMVSKKFDDGSEWFEPVAIPIPDLFYLFKVEGVDPAEMVDESCFEFQKAKIEIGSWVEGVDEWCGDASTCYWQCRAARM